MHKTIVLRSTRNHEISFFCNRNVSHDEEHHVFFEMEESLKIVFLNLYYNADT